MKFTVTSCMAPSVLGTLIRKHTLGVSRRVWKRGRSGGNECPTDRWSSYRKKIAIIGAGGFAREVAWLIRDINRVTPQFEFLGFLVSNTSLLHETDSRDEVLGDFNWLDGGDHADALVF